ncbi:MAG: DUF2628 domain-containing protein [Methylocella sp.]|nr:MAG: hypothetical protein DLM68_12840 [Hyphomicrobiales bacterium]
MVLYSVHLRGNGPQSVAEAAFVRQAFSWKAFFFGPLWLLRHRLWAGLAMWAAAYSILIAASLTVVSAGAGLFMSFALQMLLGLEANRLRETKLARQGYRLVEIISAPARDDVEIAFYRQFEAPDDPLADIASGARGGAGS